jgi:hypothetical protein
MRGRLGWTNAAIGARLALLDRARTAACPSCEGDADCPTCGGGGKLLLPLSERQVRYALERASDFDANLSVLGGTPWPPAPSIDAAGPGRLAAARAAFARSNRHAAKRARRLYDYGRDAGLSRRDALAKVRAVMSAARGVMDGPGPYWGKLAHAAAKAACRREELRQRVAELERDVLGRAFTRPGRGASIPVDLAALPPSHRAAITRYAEGHPADDAGELAALAAMQAREDRARAGWAPGLAPDG